MNMKILKPVSIIMIVLASIALVGIFLMVLGAGAFLGAIGGDVGLGLGLSSLVGVLLALGAGLELAAGILGVQGKNKNACFVFAVILLVFGGIDFVSAVFNNGNILTAMLGLVLPVLYFVGVKTTPATFPQA